MYQLVQQVQHHLEVLEILVDPAHLENPMFLHLLVDLLHLIVLYHQLVPLFPLDQRNPLDQMDLVVLVLLLDQPVLGYLDFQQVQLDQCLQ